MRVVARILQGVTMPDMPDPQDLPGPARLLTDLGVLWTSGPLERLHAIRRLRLMLDGFEAGAVAEARQLLPKASWDELASILGTTRWTAIRRFGGQDPGTS